MEQHLAILIADLSRCWTQLPQVFDPKIKKWINPDALIQYM